MKLLTPSCRRRLLALSMSALTLGTLFAGCAGKSQQTTDVQDTQTQNNTQNSQNSQNSTQKEETSSIDAADDFDDDIDIAGVQKAVGNTIDLADYPDGVLISTQGTYNITGSSTAPIVVNAQGQNVVLNLDSVSIDNADGPALYSRHCKDLTINLKGQNSFTSTGNASYEALNAALYSKSDLILSGDGSLSIQSSNGHGIKAKDTFTMDSVSLDITAAGDGIHSNEDFLMKSGTAVISSQDEGIQSKMSLQIDSGDLTISSQGDAIRCEDVMTIKGGNYALTTQNEGLESKNTMVIDGGTFLIQAADDGLNAKNSLTINDGDLVIQSSTNDGVDSNGDLYLNGGNITVLALRTPEGAFDTDNTPFVVSGGTIVGLSATASLPTQCQQNTIMVSASSPESIELRQGGKTVLSWSIPASVSLTASAGGFDRGGMGMTSGSVTLMLSSPDIQANTETELYINGEKTQTFTTSSGLTTVGTISTMGGMGGGMGGGKGQGGMNRQPGGRGNFSSDTTQDPSQFDSSARPSDGSDTTSSATQKS